MNNQGGGGSGRGGGQGGGQGRGGGSGRGGGQGRGGGGQGRGLGPAGECVCTKCGKTVPHQPGSPCSGQKCPECGAVMIRK